MARSLGVAHVEVLHTFSRKQADSPAFVEPLRHATGVWITGGAGNWLVDSYMGTRTETELIALLARGGVVAGSSAGALIWGSKVLVYRARPGAPVFENDRPEDLAIGNLHENAFGLLRNVLIAPHFTEFGTVTSMERFLPANPGFLGIGIDEDTALEVHGEVGNVLGRGAVTVFDGRGAGAPPVALKSGARYDLRKRVAM
jgi:cyanophycinase